MGFLDNLAMRRVEKNLRPFMRDDERLLEYDIADVTPLGNNMPVVLSNRAIYFFLKDRDTAVRIPYPHIMDLQGRGDTLIAFATFERTYRIHIKGKAKGDIYTGIANQLQKIVLHQEAVDVPGGSIVAICRVVEEDGEPVWALRPSEDVDMDSPEVQHAVEDALAPVIEKTGVPVKWASEN